MDKTKALNSLLILALLATTVAAGILTPNGLSKYQDGDTDWVQQQNNNMDLLDSMATDSPSVSTITVSEVAFINGTRIQGTFTNAEIQSLACPEGKGGCVAYSSDEGDEYIAQSSTPGDYRNSRTGKSP